MELSDFYFLRLFKSSHNYLRISRNSAFECRFSKKILDELRSCDAIYLIGNGSLSKFCIVGLNNFPVVSVKCHFVVKSDVPERVKFMLRMDFYKHDTFGKEVVKREHFNALVNYSEALNKSLFS